MVPCTETAHRGNGKEARIVEQVQPSAEGLRYRKKLKARLAVERSALELVIERGYDGVTVEDICARAEISKKTFFNYFPSKASAITGRMDSFPDAEHLFAILEEHDEACYLDVLVGIVGTSLASGVDEGVVELRREALRSMPQLFFHGQRDLLAVQRSIAAALRSYLSERPERRMLRSTGGRGGARCLVDGHRPRAHALDAVRLRRQRALGNRHPSPRHGLPVGGGCRQRS